MDELPLKQVLSVNVGKPRRVETESGTVVTSIFKSPVSGRVPLRGFNLEGDRQSDLKVHGGPYKAVYFYPSEHYAYWEDQLPDASLSFGAFGENLTTQGLLEGFVHIGDQFRIGSAILQITQPRMPCYKLGLRFNRPDMVKRFWSSGFSGFYSSVVQEGDLATGDTIEPVRIDSQQVTIAEVVRLYKGELTNFEVFERMLRAPLHGSWKKDIQERWAERTT